MTQRQQRMGRPPTRRIWVKCPMSIDVHVPFDFCAYFRPLFSFFCFLCSFYCASIRAFIFNCLIIISSVSTATGYLCCAYIHGLGWFNSFAGDVKRRFASYLKVNLSEERRLVNEEFNCQAARQQNLPQPSFAPTNPFLDAADSYLVSPPQEPAVEKLKLDRRHRSPDPPPRYNRQSPLLLRKKLEMSNWGGSPLLSRR